MATKINLSDNAKTFIHGKIDDMFNVCDDIYGAVISSVDGHLVLDVIKRELPVKKISAMTSSLMALGETVSKESEQGVCEYVNVENKDGRVIVLRVGESLTLTTLSSKNSNLGMVLSASTIAANAIGEAINNALQQK